MASQTGYTQLYGGRPQYLPHGGPRSTTSLVSANSNGSNPFNDHSSISGKFNLSPDPRNWGNTMGAEDDDWLHDPRKGKKLDDNGTIFTLRGLGNVGCIAILGLGLTALFAGYPLISYFLLTPKLSNLGGYNVGGINSTGQVTQMAFNLIDPDTPQSAYTRASVEDPSQTLQLVFSDEFNVAGRTFYPGDDPFWEAVDLWYWPTFDLEWYDPQQVTTENGYLKITIDNIVNHGMNYMSGMVTTWNKFCFTGGLIEASVSLPGSPTISGFWPAVWTMGNLGRAGYGATTDGLWPYTYEACDVGTLPNQTLNNLPIAATDTGIVPEYNYALSFLPGQRLSSCTCAGEQHPGPVYSNGSFVGRSAPEIDVLECQVNQTTLVGEASQSIQFAPFDANYAWNNETFLLIDDPTLSYLNSYQGSVLQQTGSVVTTNNQQCYTGASSCFSLYGFEYKPGYQADGGYVTWINNSKKVWTFQAGGIGSDAATEISARPIPKEPMYILVNLGLASGFSPISPDLVYPSYMHVDYIRVYQPKDAINYGCDPDGFPTNNYINQYIDAYTNPNLTSWVKDYGQTWPKNRLVDSC